MTEQELTELLLENRRYRKALEFISEWNLPDVKSSVSDRMVPYSVEYGSNGARDYIRNIASTTLKGV